LLRHHLKLDKVWVLDTSQALETLCSRLRAPADSLPGILIKQSELINSARSHLRTARHNSTILAFQMEASLRVVLHEAKCHAN
jgi:hypothetical protein